MPIAVLFWVSFFIFIALLFYLNREQIRKTMEVTHFIDRLLNRPLTVEAPPPAGSVEPDVPEDMDFVPRNDFPGNGDWEEEFPQEAPFPAFVSAAEEAAAPEEAPPPEEAPLEEASPVQEAPAPPPAARRQEPAPPIPEPERRNRSIYFMRLDRDGTVVRTTSSRSLAVSNSPLADTLRALLQGPTAEERQQGMVSFIPPGTRILDIRIRGTTAYINFSEEFQFGIFGAEGYAAQLRQIVWTATEFPTVKDVQILIEGRVVNFLGESILIGSPISRDALY
jgi:hypothetical protein